jgi:hypothetical protein
MYLSVHYLQTSVFVPQIPPVHVGGTIAIPFCRIRQVFGGYRICEQCPQPFNNIYQHHLTRPNSATGLWLLAFWPRTCVDNGVIKYMKTALADYQQVQLIATTASLTILFIF